MTDIPIKKCGRLFKFQCPKQWEELSPTKAPTMRFCSTCQKNVYLCKSIHDLERNADHCIAVLVEDIEREARGGPFMYRVGEPLRKSIDEIIRESRKAK